MCKQRQVSKAHLFLESAVRGRTAQPGNKPHCPCSWGLGSVRAPPRSALQPTESCPADGELPLPCLPHRLYVLTGTCATIPARSLKDGSLKCSHFTDEGMDSREAEWLPKARSSRPRVRLAQGGQHHATFSESRLGNPPDRLNSKVKIKRGF